VHGLGFCLVGSRALGWEEIRFKVFLIERGRFAEKVIESKGRDKTCRLAASAFRICLLELK
jgi:hypothetical protein